MAALRSGLAHSCVARCLLAHSGNQSRTSTRLSDLLDHLLVQRSGLHTTQKQKCSGPSSRNLLSRSDLRKLVWVNAVTVRHNSTQIPPVDGLSEAPLVQDFHSPPVLESVSLPPDPIITQPIIQQTPQIPVEPVEPVELVEPVSNLLSTEPFLSPLSDAAPTVADVLQAAAEPTLVQLGLGASTPVGLIQNILEFMHLNLGLSWCGAIVLGTVTVRLLLFPVIVKGQREAAKLNNVLPQITKLTTRMNEAKNSGNSFEFSKTYSELTLFQKKHDVNPLRSFLIPLVQAPVFISFFIALRKMSYLPVPSMQTGGVLWFTDLTAADPLYLLPLAVTGTMFFILELGAESGLDNPNLRAMKTVFRIMPFVILPLTVNIPTAVFTYWLTSNLFSLGQVALLRHPAVRDRFGIPEKIEHPSSAMPQNDGLIESMKKGWKNAKLGQQLQERERRIKNHLDLASKGPLTQTFTHNPLQQKPPVSAKDKTPAAKAKPWKETIG